jgi:hypothetical protein
MNDHRSKAGRKNSLVYFTSHDWFCQVKLQHPLPSNSQFGDAQNTKPHHGRRFLDRIVVEVCIFQQPETVAHHTLTAK